MTCHNGMWNMTGEGKTHQGPLESQGERAVPWGGGHAQQRQVIQAVKSEAKSLLLHA